MLLSRYLNVQTLLAWLSSRQYAPEGGFAGRTNKLVDGCYSTWVGGCWSLLESCLSESEKSPFSSEEGSVWSREALIRYTLCCCQAKKGGLRDKPSKYVHNPTRPSSNWAVSAASDADMET